jgi:hypothetical protein
LIGLKVDNEESFKKLIDMKQALGILMLALAASAHGQEVTTRNIEWSFSNSFEASTGRPGNEPGKVATYRQDSILWLDGRGAVKKVLAIKGVRGSWADISAPGEILYQVEGGQQRGVVVIKRAGTETVIRFVLMGGGGPASQAVPDIHEMTVASTQVLP